MINSPAWNNSVGLHSSDITFSARYGACPFEVNSGVHTFFFKVTAINYYDRVELSKLNF